MDNTEIERKFLIEHLPDLEQYQYKELQQGYLCTDPTIRVRREDDTYYMTYKGKGKKVREEYNLPLNEEAYNKLLPKCEGRVIAKRRHIIPYIYEIDGNKIEVIIELDVFAEDIIVRGEHLIMAEVEFDNEQMADNFVPPSWFGKEVTEDSAYHNSNMI